MDPTVIFEDNKGAKKWSEDPSHHAKTKHIDICFHSIREQVGKTINVLYCETKKMLADLFTKALAASDFWNAFRSIFGSKDEKNSANDTLKSANSNNPSSRGDDGPTGPENPENLKGNYL